MTVTPVADPSTYLGHEPGVERLYDNIQAMIPSAPLALIKMFAWNTVEDFYIQSGYRRETVYWEMAACVHTVDFNPYDQDWLVAWIGGITGLTNFRINPPAQLIDLDEGVACRTGQALLLLKPPGYAEEGCGCLGSELWSNWFETITHGVLARLYAVPSRPWTAPQVATVYESKYLRGRSRARAVAQGGYGHGGGRWRFPYYAAGRRKS